MMRGWIHMGQRLLKTQLFSVLEFKDFKNIWLSQVFSQIALNMVTFALVLHIYELTNSATSIAMVMFASAIPVAIFGPFSGAIADRVNYRKILLFTGIFRFFAAILLLMSQFNVLGLLEIILTISALSQFFTPAESSSIPLVVPKEKLVQANSLVMITTYATLIFGYAVAGPLLGLLGSQFLFLLCALLFLFATISTKNLSDFDKKIHKTTSLDSLAKDLAEIWSESKEGFKYIIKDKTVFTPMIKLTIGWIILGALITLLPAYGEKVLNINTKIIGLVILAPSGLGMLISAWVLSRKKNCSHNNLMNTGYLLLSISLLVFSGYHFYQFLPFSKIIMYLSAFVVGFGCSMIQIPSQTLLHLNSKDHVRGRVFGLSSMLLRLATTLPAFIFGAMADLFSPLVTMIFVAIAAFVYSITLIFEPKSDQ